MRFLKNLFNKRETKKQPQQMPSKNKRIVVNFHIDSKAILQPYQDLKTYYIDEESITNALYNLGIEAKLIKCVSSSALSHYDFKLINPSDIDKIEHLKSRLRVILNSRVFFSFEEKGCDFSLYVEASHRQIVPFSFCNPQGDKILSPVIGVDTNNEKVMINFLECTHVLIAGSIEDEKISVINTLISSLLINNDPCKFRLRLFDLKRYESENFSELSIKKPYLAEPQVEILNDLDSSIKELEKICKEIESRLITLQLSKVKNIVEFNKKFDNSVPHEFIVVYELANLMLANRSAVEKSLATISRIGGLCGYHLILATHCPSTNVITELLKINLTTRIALQVANARESVAILDHKGAEELLGQGDALIRYPNETKEVRFQAAHITNEEINKLVDWWANFSDYEEQDI